MEKKDTRSDIIKIGTELISRQGYNATGIEMVLKEAGVPKGSFYHYFKSKEEFGLAVMDVFADYYSQRMTALLQDTTMPPLGRIRTLLEGSLERFSRNQCSKGCLIGNLGQEMADQNERFRARLDEIFADWKQLFAACLQEAQQSGSLRADCECELMASFILSGWEGAILRAKVMKSPQPLQDFIQILFSQTLS
ncbi:TetR family transcriptional regulator C-terminal domain-containing protein [Trichlorobacter lovleyi]|uniref:TetR/AcrR family transcriptional regulator n=1 Tax=Trichlorobacter lovleyi TaxID=313985 RepID=UPI00223EFDA4|nr:TetR/AcrR family transcriptional regulator [Trichlorobacter lovleyi]QOX77515.1 TetR family transcriptional regulator C-terminal domain-containing protein [Trichlorobacter lovleyi]